MKTTAITFALSLLLALLLAAEHDGKCGEFNDFQCPKDSPCCSKFGFCGSTDHCLPGICIANCPQGVIPIREAQLSMANSAISFDQLPKLEHYNIHSQCKNPKHVALTFDDGVHSRYTPVLLEILRKKKAPATFFILGNSLSRWSDLGRTKKNADYKKNRSILKQMVADGHEVGIHTFDHSSMIYQTKEQIERQINITQALLDHCVKKKSNLFRPPEGSIAETTIDILNDMGYLIIHWNCDPQDWRQGANHMAEIEKFLNTRKTADQKISKNKGGVILLQHDTIEETVYVQPHVIDYLRQQGYKLVTMSECLGLPAMVDQ